MAEPAPKNRSSAQGGRGINTGVFGGVLWLLVMTGFDVYARESYTHTAKQMATIVLGTTRADALGIGFPAILGVALTVALFIGLGIVFSYLSGLLPIEVSVILGFLFGCAVTYFLFHTLLSYLPTDPTPRLDASGLIVANLAVGVVFGLKLHK